MNFVNWPIQTGGGHLWWDTLDTKHGWKLQQNKVTGHYRILDPEDIRQAWDTSYSAILRDFKKFIYED